MSNADSLATPEPLATSATLEEDERISRNSGAFGQASPEAPPPPNVFARLKTLALALLRDPNPILLKELRATYRTALYVRFLYLSTGLVGLFVLAGGASFAAGERPPADVGRMVFHLFFTSVVFVLSLIAPAYAAASITSERETHTFESLILSGMGPWRIVLGKFFACYGSVILVVIAVSPVVGVAFLFGGVSPLAVITGFFWILMLLAPAVALGVAISARLDSTRIAIVVATFVFVPIAMFTSGFLVGMGELAQDAWSTPFEGPFWFAEAFPERIFEWDGWVFLVLVPLYLTAMPTWLCLASAVAGIRPMAEDRSSSLKWWTVAATLGLTALVPLFILPVSGARDRGEASVAFAIAAATLPFFIALLFADEPPLPPRPSAPPSLLSRLLSPVGPGAAGTMRFVMLAIFVSAMSVPCALIVTRHLLDMGFHDALRYDVALLALGVGNCAVAAFLAGITGILRQLLRHALAARVLAIAIMVAGVLLPFLFTLVIEPRALDHMNREVPILVHLSPILPTILAVGIGPEGDMPLEDAMALVITVLGYGLLAVAAWIAVEAHVVRAGRALAARKARWAGVPLDAGPAAPAPAPETASSSPQTAAPRQGLPPQDAAPPDEAPTATEAAARTVSAQPEAQGGEPEAQSGEPEAQSGEPEAQSGEPGTEP